MKPIIQFETITKTFMIGDYEHHALDSVSLDIFEGECLGLMGPSGSGKSTLLHLAAGFDKPNAGTIRIAGQGILDLPDSEISRLRNRKIGFVFQAFNLLPHLTLLENIVYPAKIYKTPALDYDYYDQARALLKRIDLEAHQKKRPHQLSGGQRQRVAIARALVNRPPIVFADEPTANLDSKTGENVLALMKELSVETGTTFVIATHDGAIHEVASRIVHLLDGKIAGGEPS